jgi:hypothetical protein
MLLPVIHPVEEFSASFGVLEADKGKFQIDFFAVHKAFSHFPADGESHFSQKIYCVEI